MRRVACAALMLAALSLTVACGSDETPAPTPKESITGTVSAGSVTKEYVCSAAENGADNWIAEGTSFG